MKLFYVLPLLMTVAMVNAVLLPQPVTYWGVGDQNFKWLEGNPECYATFYDASIVDLDSPFNFAFSVTGGGTSFYVAEALATQFPEGVFNVQRRAFYPATCNGTISVTKGILVKDTVLDTSTLPSATIKLAFNLPLATQGVKLRVVYPDLSIHYFLLPPNPTYEMPVAVYAGMPSGAYVIQGAAQWGTKTYAFGNAVVHVK
jgi:hypothetical protein